MAGRIATARNPWHYTESGLSNIYLVGIEVVRDPETGEEEPVIPCIEDLHECIFLNLIKKPGPLTGREFRFLRRHLLWSCAKAADVLRSGPPRTIKTLEEKRADKRFFDQIGVDFFWRSACLEEFCRRASGVRKKQAEDLLSSLKTVRREVQKPPTSKPIRIQRKSSEAYGEIWESPLLRAA